MYALYEALLPLHSSSNTQVLSMYLAGWSPDKD